MREPVKRSPQQGEQPARWKMALLTFVPAYIVSALLQYTPLVLLPALVANFVITLLLVGTLTYVFQPLLMRWLARWLFPPVVPQPEPLYRAFLRYKRRQRRQRATRVYIY
jgi:antibiotic biosynthesis monooxygenase (ABM) superfamily enzyme